MKFNKIAEQIIMRRHFIDRTNRHINLVKKWANIIVKNYPEFSELIERAKIHDASKFQDPEIEPYIKISWSYKMKDEGKTFNIDNETKERLTKATEHHITTNDHHPEFFCDRKTNLLNKTNRDKIPETIIDATKMTSICIAEMCADWLAVGEERGNTAKDWADKVINKRWKFTNEQQNLIYKLVNLKD